MERIDQKINFILASIPDEPTDNLSSSQRALAQSLRHSATAQFEFTPTPNFQLLRFHSLLRPIDYGSVLSVTIDRKYPLEDFLLDFIETTISMGITDPFLCREYPDRTLAVIDYDTGFSGGADVADETEEERKHREKQEQYYLKNIDERIVSYRDTRDLWMERNLGAAEREERYFYTTLSRRGNTVTMNPTENPIGQLPPTLVLEAYLLHLLDREKIYTSAVDLTQ